MECPRCGSELERYTLDGREAVSCERCGYVGVPVEHRGERQRVDSWGDAIERVPNAARIESVTVETLEEGDSLEIVLGTDGDAASSEEPPTPTVVRVDQPDSALTSALEAAGDADSRIVCEVCGAEFNTRQQLYGHLASHSE
jgi:transcription elongation factor Elf1